MSVGFSKHRHRDLGFALSRALGARLQRACRFDLICFALFCCSCHVACIGFIATLSSQQDS